GRRARRRPGFGALGIGDPRSDPQRRRRRPWAFAPRRVAGLESATAMIYCVVPEELAPELYDQLASYYSDDPNVEVIIDRRKSERRSRAGGEGEVEPDEPHTRETRDR